MAQDSAPRRAAPCSDAREPRPRVAHAHWRPCAQRSPSDKRARAEHLTAHAALRAQHTSPDTPRACRRLQHARQPGERTRRKAPARPQRHAAARAALPPPARHPLVRYGNPHSKHGAQGPASHLHTRMSKGGLGSQHRHRILIVQQNVRGYPGHIASCPVPREHSRAHETWGCGKERMSVLVGRAAVVLIGRVRAVLFPHNGSCVEEVGLHVIGRHTQPVEDMAVVTNALRVERVVVRVAQLVLDHEEHCAREDPHVAPR
mmetsp:Transcript_59938/g.158269  ORF Transcript_59938/g.158269 Transcript_59938/m.158269 type:complete len:260 (-) Transcript_59938:798-1577(-)